MLDSVAHRHRAGGSIALFPHRESGIKAEGRASSQCRQVLGCLWLISVQSSASLRDSSWDRRQLELGKYALTSCRPKTPHLPASLSCDLKGEIVPLEKCLQRCVTAGRVALCSICMCGYVSGESVLTKPTFKVHTEVRILILSMILSASTVPSLHTHYPGPSFLPYHYCLHIQVPEKGQGGE